MISLINILAVGVTGDDGEPLENGTVTFYEAGTTTLKTVYEEFELENPHSNPATLDDAGRLIAYADGRLKLVISNSSGTVVRTIDDVGTADSDLTIAVAGETLAGNGIIVNDEGALSVNVDATTLSISSDVVSVADDGVGEDQLADDAVTTDKIADDAVTGDKLANAITVATSVKVTSTGGTLVGLGATKTLGISDGTTSLPIVTSAASGSNSLKIIRGRVSAADASISQGAGFTASLSATGFVDITFTTAFSEIPTVVVSRGDGSFAVSCTGSTNHTTSGVQIFAVTTAGTGQGVVLDFIAAGHR